MRDPYIRIKLSVLKRLIPNFNAYEKEVLKNNKALFINSEKEKQSDTDLFNLMLFTIRKELKHKGASVIMRKDSSYKNLADIAELAIDFCKAFKLNKDEGFNIYIKLGLSIIKDYSLNKFKYYNQQIFQSYAEYIDVVNDENPKITEMLIKEYQRLSKLDFAFKKHAFVLTSKFIKEKNARPEIWIKAQFEGLEFTGTIPELSQLYTEKAFDRYVKYLKAIEDTVQTINPATIDFKQIDNENRRDKIRKALNYKDEK